MNGYYLNFQLDRETLQSIRIKKKDTEQFLRCLLPLIDGPSFEECSVQPSPGPARLSVAVYYGRVIRWSPRASLQPAVSAPPRILDSAACTTQCGAVRWHCTYSGAPRPQRSAPCRAHHTPQTSPRSLSRRQRLHIPAGMGRRMKKMMPVM